MYIMKNCFPSYSTPKEESQTRRILSESFDLREDVTNMPENFITICRKPKILSQFTCLSRKPKIGTCQT